MKLLKILFALMAVLYLSSCSEDGLMDTSLTNDNSTINLNENLGDEQFFIDDYLSSQNPNVSAKGNFRTKGNNTIKKKIKDYYKANKEEKDRLVKAMGHIMWDHMLTFTMDDHEFSVLPVGKKKSTYTEGLLFVLTDEGSDVVSIAYERRNEFGHLPQKSEEIDGSKLVDLQMILLFYLMIDQEIYDYTDCKLVNLFEETENKRGRPNKSDCRWENVLVESTIYYDCVGPITDPTYYCHNYSALFVYEYELFCNDGSGSYVGTGIIQGNDSPNGSGTTSGSTGSSDDNITDGSSTPCVKDIISKIKDDNFGNDLFVEVLRDVFNVSDNVNITIVEENLPSATDGDFYPDLSQGSAEHNIFFFDGTVRINSDYTSSGTEDWILATIIHEMIHGYIDYQRARVSAGFTPQAQFDQMFPLFSMDNTGHLTMGYQYVNTIADILQLNNPSLGRYEALSLSRAGLSETGFWSFSLTNQEKQDAVNYTLVGRGTQSDSTSKQKKCEL